MTGFDEMPPDPFDDDGVDPFAVQAAEQLVHDGADPVDPRWDRLGAEPTVDDFTRAEFELDDACDPDSAEECATGPFTAMLPWLSAIAVIVAIAVFLTYALR